MYRRLVPALLLMFVASGCGGAADNTAESPSGKTEVVIVGTDHLITDMQNGYTPGHLRAMLAKIKPDIIAIEAATNVDNPMETAPYECIHVTRPWANQNKVPVVAVGLLEPEYQQQVSAMLQEFKNKGKEAQYTAVEQRLQQDGAIVGADCESMNGTRYQKIWRDYHTQIHQLHGGATPWESWNAKVVHKIRKLCQDNPGKRIAVVFGATHSYFLNDYLSDGDDISVVSTNAFLPISAAELKEHTDRLDYLKAMRPLNLSTVTPQQLRRAEALLDNIKGVPSLESDYALFHGKMLMHSGDVTSALKSFDRLASSAGDAISKFDGRSRIADGARLSAVLTLTKAGRNAEARNRLSSILADASSQQDVKQYAQELLSSLTGQQDEPKVTGTF